MTAGDLLTLVRKRFAPPERWACFTEVHNGTGASHSRSCDVLAMALWPSDGLEIHGLELKTSRSDWLKELRDPAKAEAFRRYCDRWWLVAADRTVATKDEVLAAGWGLLWPRSDKLVVGLGAPKREAEPMPRKVLAALLRRAQEGAPGEAERAAIRAQAYDAGRAEGRRTAPEATELPLLRRKLDALERSVADFERASGVRIGQYDGRHVGALVARVQNIAETPALIGQFERLHQLAGQLERATAEAANVSRDIIEEKA